MKYCLALIAASLLLAGCYVPPTITPAMEVMLSETAPGDKTFALTPETALNMIGIGCGSFVMGIQHYSPYNGTAVGHKVTLTNHFWMAQHEFTQKQYKALMGTATYPHKKECPFNSLQQNQLPLCCLTWDDANALVEKLNRKYHAVLPEGYRFSLPTEAQWEYACRAGTTGTFNDGSYLQGAIRKLNVKSPYVMQRTIVYESKSSSLDKLAWYSANSNKKIHEVCQKKPNFWNLYDMHGNIAEWCSDWYDSYKEPAEYKLQDRALNMIDPVGRASRKNSYTGHVIRGGDFYSTPQFVASWSRFSEGNNPEHFFWQHAGLRPVLSKPSVERVDPDPKVYGLDWAYVDIKNDSNAITRDIILENSLDIALVVLDASVQITDQIIRIENARKGGSFTAAGTVSGNGQIRGPGVLRRNKSATYHLYIKGKKVNSSNIRWRAAGTSITLNDCGSYARVMAGNPPSLSFNTRIEAHYGGRRFTKTITINK